MKKMNCKEFFVLLITAIAVVNRAAGQSNVVVTIIPNYTQPTNETAGTASSNEAPLDAGTASMLVAVSGRNKAIQQGKFDYLASQGETYGDVDGRGQLVHNFGRTTTGSISVSGLPANTFFASRLHRAPCDEGAGEPMQDPVECPLNEDGTNSCVGTFPGNALEFSGTTDASGRLVVQSTADWGIPWYADKQWAKDLSIVIYDTPNNGVSILADGPKMLCVDLDFRRRTWGEISYVNSFPFSDTVKLIKATLARSKKGTTTAHVIWSGLRPDFKYPSHIHAAPCTEVSNGGPHYVRDIGCVGNEGGAGCPATAETEFWVGFTTNHRGKARVWTTIRHLARAGALSLVLHECLDANGDPDPTGACAGGKPRFVCVDFK